MKRQPSASRLRAAIMLVLLAAASAALLAALDRATRERITSNEAERVLRQLQVVLPPVGDYDNAPQLDVIMVTSAAALGSDKPLPVYRARQKGQPVAAVLTVIAPDGYVGNIWLLVGISFDGKVTGVRATAHNETPGLGDGIDTSRSDWILGFAGRGQGQSDAPAWALQRDGGDFDQLTGATITSRAVVNASYRALNYFNVHRDELFANAN